MEPNVSYTGPADMTGSEAIEVAVHSGAYGEGELDDGKMVSWIEGVHVGEPMVEESGDVVNVLRGGISVGSLSPFETFFIDYLSFNFLWITWLSCIKGLT